MCARVQVILNSQEGSDSVTFELESEACMYLKQTAPGREKSEGKSLEVEACLPCLKNSMKVRVSGAK